jgi:hypothetical protein
MQCVTSQGRLPSMWLTRRLADRVLLGLATYLESVSFFDYHFEVW